MQGNEVNGMKDGYVKKCKINGGSRFSKRMTHSKRMPRQMQGITKESKCSLVRPFHVF